MDLRGRSHRPKGLPDESDRILCQLRRRFISDPQDDEGDDRLALNLVGLSNYCRLGYLGVGHQGRLDLGVGYPVACDAEDVIDSALDEEVAVLIPLRLISGEIDAAAAGNIPVELPVLLHEPLFVAPERPEHRRIGLQGHYIASGSQRNLIPILIQDGYVISGERECARSGLQWRDWQRRVEEGSGLSLPPGVHDLELASSNVLTIPHPGLRIDRLAHRSEQPQA